jgi:anti-anti-sigma factor
MFSYEIRGNTKEANIYLSGDLDIDVTEIIEVQLLPELEQYQKINIDFLKVPFVDSTGIGLLINIVDTLKKNNEELCIQFINIQPLVKEVFEMLQLSEIFEGKVSVY